MGLPESIYPPARMHDCGAATGIFAGHDNQPGGTCTGRRWWHSASLGPGDGLVSASYLWRDLSSSGGEPASSSSAGSRSRTQAYGCFSTWSLPTAARKLHGCGNWLPGLDTCDPRDRHNNLYGEGSILAGGLRSLYRG